MPVGHVEMKAFGVRLDAFHFGGEIRKVSGP
jgi:hypothetical protein